MLEGKEQDFDKAVTESTAVETEEKKDALKEKSDASIPKINTEESNEPSTEAVVEDPIEEIEESVAEDAEDSDNHQRHHIRVLDYHSMSMENLVGELQRLVRNEKVQAIKKHVDGIKFEFDQKFQEFLEHKKEEFVANGGSEVDFRYNSVTKRLSRLSR